MSDSSAALNPTGGAGDGHRLTPPALPTDLMDKILNPVNMHLAWQRVKSNRGAPGIDGMTIEDFPAFARLHWAGIRQALLDGTYRPQPVRRKMIPKRSGGERPLGIPTVVDRVIQQAIAQILTPIFDPHFSESSHGFRPYCSAHGALRQMLEHVQAGHHIVVDLDLKKFFDNVPHDILMWRVARRVDDRRVLALIGRFLRAGVSVGDCVQPTGIGTPQGGPLSPLLANILLDELDRHLEHRGHRFVRYADDLVVLVRSPRAGERVMRNLVKFLERQLRLPVNGEKSQVVPISQCQFLGFTFYGNRRRGYKLRWSSEALAEFERRIRELTGRSWGVSMKYRLFRLGQYLRGWMGYFGISDYYRPIPELDEWLRRRIRMCYWKQWRRFRTRVRHLLALGVSPLVAINTAKSSKGYWHISRTPGLQQGMSNVWLRSQGLLSIRALWMKAHGYT